jgi:N-acetyl-anhydromuramyl-L-alanine amidase AmpD
MKIIDRTKTTKITNLKSNKPKYLIIHSTLSYPSFNKLLKFHRKRGWVGVGYHFFISKFGKIYQARPVEKEGAHAKGFNFESIGICVYRKEEKPSEKNLKKLKWLVNELKRKYPKLKIVSHSFMQLKYINKNLNKQIKFDYKKFNEIKKKLNDLNVKDIELKKYIINFNDCPGNWFYSFFSCIF